MVSIATAKLKAASWKRSEKEMVDKTSEKKKAKQQSIAATSVSKRSLGPKHTSSMTIPFN